MTDEEKQAIISDVLKSLETNSVTVEQLTATTSLADTDSIEVSGGRRVTYATLKELIKAAIADLLNDYGGSVSGKSLKSATATATASEVTITITNVDGKAVSASVPVASASSAGVLTASDYSKIIVVDAKPTTGSVHPVQSGGVKSALDSVPIVDVMNLLGLSAATTLQDILNGTVGNQYAWLRTSGRVLSVLTKSGWESFQFTGSDLSDWTEAQKWKKFGSGGEKGDPGADAVVYRLLPGALVYKADTTAVSLSLLKTEGESTTTAELPSGWRVVVSWNATGGQTKSATLTTLASVNPNSLAGSTSVQLELYTADPQVSGSTAKLVDSATLLLVADGKKGDKGDDGTLTNYPIEAVSGSELVLSDIYPNRIYKVGTCTSVSVDVVHYSDGTNGSDFSAHGGIADEYVLDFVAGASCQVSLPAALKWAFTPSFEEGKRYVISIVDNLAIAAEFNAE